MKKKVVLIISFISCLMFVSVFAFTGCGSSAMQDEVQNNEAVQDDAWKAAYKQVLKDNEALITPYEWQEPDMCSEEGLETKPIALYDVNNDQIPELFFFTVVDTVEDYYESAVLNIYTFSNRELKKMEYQCIDYYDVGATTNGFEDRMVSAGVSYAVVPFKEHDGFAIYYSFSADIMNECRCAVYEVNDDSIEMVKSTRYEEYMLGDYEDGIEPGYYVDEQVVWYDEYNSTMMELFEKSDALILNSYEYFGQGLWDNISMNDSQAMTYSEAIDSL